MEIPTNSSLKQDKNLKQEKNLIEIISFQNSYNNTHSSWEKMKIYFGVYHLERLEQLRRTYGSKENFEHEHEQKYDYYINLYFEN